MTKVVKLKKDSTNNKDSEIKQLNSKLNRMEKKIDILYERLDGHIVKIDKVYAHMWASIASSNGFENAKGLLESLNKEMTPSQIQEAERLARECIKKNYKGC